MGKSREDILRDLVNSSGYLLQLRLEREVNKTSHDHGWEVVLREHPWSNSETGTEGYIDLVLAHKVYDPLRMVIECKRRRDSDWIFLVPDNAKMKVKRTRHAWVDQEPNKKLFFGWHDWFHDPESPEAEFCVVKGQGDKDTPLLEREATLLLDSIEALAEEEGEWERAHEMADRIFGSKS